MSGNGVHDFQIDSKDAAAYTEGRGLHQRKATTLGDPEYGFVGASSVLREDKRNTVWERSYPTTTDSAATYLLGEDRSEVIVRDVNSWGAILMNFLAVFFGAWVFGLFGTLGTVIQQGVGILDPTLGFILLLANALTQGIGLWIAIVLVGDISADFNPMILFVEAFMPHFRKTWGNNMGTTILVWIAVQVGAFAGFVAGAASSLALELIAPINAGTPIIITTNSRALFAESIIAGIFTWAYLTSTYDPRRTVAFGNRPMFLGFVWTGCVLLVGLYTGAAGNMWRHLAPALITSTWVPATDWIYYAGNAIGTVIAALAWYFVFRRSKTPEDAKDAK